MVIISDTNILSSFAAANALDLLAKLFDKDKICIPPAVERELQTALTYGKTHVERVIQALEAGDIERTTLTEAERKLMAALPRKLHDGEREGIVICQARKLPFLSNDRRAVNYCNKNGIRAIPLVVVLRSLWIEKILSKQEVRELIQTMTKVEKLTLNKTQQDAIFVPPRPRHRRRRRRGRRS